MGKAIYVAGTETLMRHKKIYEVVDGKNCQVRKGYVVVPIVYTELECVESSGTQYIDTGFKPNQNTRVVVDHELIGGDWPTVYGARTSVLNECCIFLTNSGMSNVACYFHTEQINVDVDADGRHVIDANKNVFSFDGTTIATAAYSDYSCDYNLFLFGYNNAGTYGNPTSMRQYSCQIYDNDILVRDYVPCKDPSGVAGLYDKVEGKFYANAGSGAFTAGAEIGMLATKGITKLFYSGETTVTYTGTHTLTQITSGGTKYNLLTMTGSGALTVEGDDAQMWICGGGSGGRSGTNNSNLQADGGGGGSGAKTASADIPEGVYTVTVGAGGNANASGTATTVFATDGTALQTASGGSVGSGSTGGSGGTGGGAGSRDGSPSLVSSTVGSGTAGTGDGVSKYPFGLSSLSAHCAGGGGGSSYYYQTSNRAEHKGGAGGSNGSNGGQGYYSSATGAGGTKGGGAGGWANYTNGTPDAQVGSRATFYGSGGGGGGSSVPTRAADVVVKSGGAGYQGVGYVLWPAS